jgi:hypothetical protein
MDTNSELYRTTLANPQWLARHRSDIEGSFPLEWTPVSMEVALRVGFKLKQCGAIWRQVDELTFFITHFVTLGWAEVQNMPGDFPRVRRCVNAADQQVRRVLSAAPPEAVVAQASDVLSQFRLPSKS